MPRKFSPKFDGNSGVWLPKKLSLEKGKRVWKLFKFELSRTVLLGLIPENWLINSMFGSTASKKGNEGLKLCKSEENSAIIEMKKMFRNIAVCSFSVLDNVVCETSIYSVGLQRDSWLCVISFYLFNIIELKKKIRRSIFLGDNVANPVTLVVFPWWVPFQEIYPVIIWVHDKLLALS